MQYIMSNISSVNIAKNSLSAGYINAFNKNYFNYYKTDNTYTYGNVLYLIDDFILDDNLDLQLYITGSKTFTGLNAGTRYYFGGLHNIKYPKDIIYGHKYTLHLEIQDNNYTGNDTTSIKLTHIIASNDYSDWNPLGSPKTIGTMNSGYCNCDLDIDAYYNSIIESGNTIKDNLYIIFGIWLRAVADSNGVIETTYPDTTFTIKGYITSPNNRVIATEIDGFNPNNYYNKTEIDQIIHASGDYITCWGDSLTAGGGWTNRLQELSGMTVYNGGTGGENSQTIVSRQGADAMVVNNITIPATTDPVLIATRSSDVGISTVEGNKVTPLLQGGAHVNPCKIGDIEGTLKWTGSSYNDSSGTWTFTRSTAGAAINITRPTILRTNFDINKNNPYLMIIFIGQNGGYSDLNDLIRQHKLIIDHANAKHYLILGLSSGTANQRAEYESKMKNEFGRYFLSLREYLSTPIYNSNNEIISCYGLDDQNLEIDTSYTYGGKTTLQEIADGTVPHQILADSVHYTSGTKTIIGDLIYKYCKELNIF